jgi:hypothetical protein
MLFANPVIAGESIPAVIHEDGTARVQTVHSRNCPILNGLLSEFGSLTGVPVLLNTSFNRAGEPIIETHRDAVLTFLDSGLDGVVLGDEMILRSQLSESQIEDVRHKMHEHRSNSIKSMRERSQNTLTRKRKTRALSFMTQSVVETHIRKVLLQHAGRSEIHVIGSEQEISKLQMIAGVIPNAFFTALPATGIEVGGMEAARDLAFNYIKRKCKSGVILLAWFELEPFVMPIIKRRYADRVVESIYPDGWTGYPD